MTKLELKSSHEVVDTVNVADVESIFYCKPTDPDILTVLMKDGKRLYCDEVCPVQEESVSEDLKAASYDYVKSNHKDIASIDDCALLYDAIEFGAKWQKAQFEKNRLKHCNSITNEQAELEQGFIDQHLDKHQRMPTFLDAIEYGMRLQKEKMMKDAIDGKIYETQARSKLKAVTTGNLSRLDYKVGDKVKVIVIKED